MKSTNWENSQIAKASAELDDALDKIFEQTDMAISQLEVRPLAGRKFSSSGRPRSRRESAPSQAEVLPDDFDSPLPDDQFDDWTQAPGKGRSGLKKGGTRPSARPGSGPGRPAESASAWEAADLSAAEDPEMIYDVSIVDEESLLEEDAQPPKAIDLSVTASFADDQEPPNLDILNDVTIPPEALTLAPAPPAGLRPPRAGEEAYYPAKSLVEAPEEPGVIKPMFTSASRPVGLGKAAQSGGTVAGLSPAELTRLIEKAVSRGVRAALKKAGG